MEKGRTIKVIILFVMALLSSILTLLDFLILDPIPLLDEIGCSGITTALWSYFVVAVKKSKKKNTQNILNK